MNIFKKIKRRARDIIRAAKGEPWGEVLRPSRLSANGQQLKVETFAAEQFIGPVIDEFVKPEAVMNCYRRGLASEIGHNLLAAGVLTEEISQAPHELGLRGYTMRLTVKVVRPEEVAGR